LYRSPHLKRAGSIIFLLAVSALAQAQDKPSMLNRVLDMVGPVEYAPITPKVRFQEYVLNTVGPLPVFGEAVGAGIGQWGNSPEEWGQGWGAFGKRYGSNLAYNGVRTTIAYGLAEVLHEDNRYFSSHRVGTGSRVMYALRSTFTARHPDGRTTFSVSGVTGVIGAGALSSIWGPASWKGPGNIAGNVAISFATTAGLNVVREFLPDLLRRKKR
jgi:hypothetical protein